MRWFRWMTTVLVGVMLLTIFSSAFAAVKDDAVSPLYLYKYFIDCGHSIQHFMCEMHIFKREMHPPLCKNANRPAGLSAGLLPNTVFILNFQ